MQGGGLFRRLFPYLPILLWLAYILLSEPLGYALFLLATVTLHETGHIFAFLMLCEPLPRLGSRRLGLLLTPRTALLSYRKEIVVCAAGPLFNLAAATALLPALRAGGGEAVLCFFAFNLAEAVFNLLPIGGFDGGRILLSALSLLTDPLRASKIAGAVSLFCVLFLYFTALWIAAVAHGNAQPLFFALLLLFGEVRRRPLLFADL